MDISSGSNILRFADLFFIRYMTCLRKFKSDLIDASLFVGIPLTEHKNKIKTFKLI